MMQYQWFSNNYGSWALPVWGEVSFLVGALFFAAIIWSLAWKGTALWRAAKRGEKAWFAALLVINTLGILEILYIYVFSKDEKTPDKTS